MPKGKVKDKTEDWYKLAQLQAAFGDKADASFLSRMTGFSRDSIAEVLKDPDYQALKSLFDNRRFDIWAYVLAEHSDIASMIHEASFAAVMTLINTLDDPDPRVKVMAAKEILDRDIHIERPTQNIQVDYKFSPAEIDKARNLVELLKARKLPQIMGVIKAEIVEDKDGANKEISD